jgi:hypothetical protein
MDWLIGKLIVQVHSYYWFIVFVKENGFAQNFIADHICKTSWQSALNILDIDVLYDPFQPYIMNIKSQFGQPDMFYTVCNPRSEMVICDCLDAKRGNLCKHVVKAYMYIKGVSPSIPLSFPLMAPLVGAMLFPNFVEPPHYFHHYH